ncbi:MAG: DUF2330 domain-containing protein, partial [Deltaproteobacteria bacterium]|nr:DUF2330 domain-containing protein [Deltaproteobacteria bacterium]
MIRSFLRFPARALAAAAPLAAAALLHTADAAACGGFFCSTTPVDQTAEHILFTINADATVTAHVQISYAGDRDAFAWIVPVPSVPKLAADFPARAYPALDLATEPRYFRSSCSQSGLMDAGVPLSAEDGGGVTVLGREVVGPFDTVTLEGDSGEELVRWLQTNGYRITDRMAPLLAPYVADKMKFVALRLLPDKDVTEITPLSMTYAGDKPMIPIRLTAVAAQPEMGLVAYILADRRYAPDNFVDLEIPDSAIEFDQYGSQNNYLSVVSRESDRVGGQAFVTEYARGTSDLVTQLEGQFVDPEDLGAVAARDRLLSLLRAHPMLTRLYARMSAEEMTTDPVFTVAADQTEVDNVHDLTAPDFDYSSCGPTWTDPVVDPCDFVYCGRMGACVTTPGAEGSAELAACVCGDDATARATTTTNGRVEIYCEPLAMDLDAPPAPLAAGASPAAPPPLFQAACEGFSCGAHGECVGMNGNPTCRCEAGYAARATTEYDPSTGAPSTAIGCLPFDGKAPPLPR